MGLVEFGESVFFIPQHHGQTRKQKFECRWQSGVFLGVERWSNELRVGNAEGVFKVRAGDIRRKVEDERWNYFDLLRVKGTPSPLQTSRSRLYWICSYWP